MPTQKGVAQRGWGSADGQAAEHVVKNMGRGQVVVVEQGGQQQALAEPPGPDEELVFAALQQRDAVRAVNLEGTAGDNVAKIGVTVGELHDCLPGVVRDWRLVF